MINHFNKQRTKIVLMLASMLLTSFAAVNTFAGANIPVTVDIPVTYIVNGNDRAAGGDTFTLIADDPASPMPDGTKAGKKTISIRKEGTYSFGNMYYDSPGVYWYTVTRELKEKKAVIKDDSVYRAKVIALNDGHGYVLVYKKGSNTKHELVFTDKTSPDTGDTADLMLYCGIAAAAAAALVIAAALLKKNIKRKGAH